MAYHLRRSVKLLGIQTTHIVLAAAFQRFGHYGLRSLLLIYLITEFKTSDRSAGQIYGFFYGSFFLTSLVGGLFGDSKLGHKRTGAFGMILMLLAQLSLAIGQVAGTLIGLLMYSIGFGLFNPNMNAAVAEQYQTDENLRGAVYTILYTAINLGAMLGPLVCGDIAIHTNSRYAFLATTPFTQIGLISFATSTSGHELGRPLLIAIHKMQRLDKPTESGAI